MEAGECFNWDLRSVLVGVRKNGTYEVGGPESKFISALSAAHIAIACTLNERSDGKIQRRKSARNGGQKQSEQPGSGMVATDEARSTKQQTPEAPWRQKRPLQQPAKKAALTNKIVNKICATLEVPNARCRAEESLRRSGDGRRLGC